QTEAARAEITSPTPLLAETARQLPPGKALDLACGTGRNALWLAANGWQVTAVDGSAAAIEILREEAARRALTVDAHVADLQAGEYQIAEAAWDFIAICYYLQRDLIEHAKRGVAPGGTLLVIVHISEPGDEPRPTRLERGQLGAYFQGWEVLHYFEGKPNDPSHRRSVAEVVARRPKS
ncbi:MAG TPA: methyltransferase domain-containing protein, partial [Bryobacteraceae bacterium]|nr:methyltransferase domain-containing protein [Bryobacteraceae bacterium]